MTPTNDRLREYLKERGMAACDLAPLLGIGRSTATKLCNGLRKPSLKLAAKIEKLTDGEIRAVDWVPDVTIEAA